MRNRNLFEVFFLESRSWNAHWLELEGRKYKTRDESSTPLFGFGISSKAEKFRVALVNF